MRKPSHSLKMDDNGNTSGIQQGFTKSKLESTNQDLDSEGATAFVGCERPKFEIGCGEDGQPIIWDPSHPAGRLTNSHWVILGGSGAGKTQTIKALVSSLSSQSIPPMLLDFKDDFVDPEFRNEISAELYNAIEGLPFNPLEPGIDPVTGKISIVAHVFAVAEALSRVYRLGDQQLANLRTALFDSYEQVGITKQSNSLSDEQKLPTFEAVSSIIKDIGDMKLWNRLSTIFELQLFSSDRGGIANLVKSPSIVRLSQLPGEETKKAAGELLLRSFYNFMVQQGHSKLLKHPIVIDEAHKIAHLESVKLLLKEARAYGVSIILSSQEARDFDDSVYSNAGTLLSLQLSETSDSQRVAMLLGGQSSKHDLSEKIRTLPPFKALLKNSHYSPYTQVKITPHYLRNKNET